jgi:hypothetical protein
MLIERKSNCHQVLKEEKFHNTGAQLEYLLVVLLRIKSELPCIQPMIANILQPLDSVIRIIWNCYFKTVHTGLFILGLTFK